ncbi:hypothetical protein B9G98_01082 [Wickerhamiella sorbophila]|uniref:RRM domain-containing protein n=1 Tax=Wickerhamiella sorbophila TaxID=45607 RepID=A0A2T0FEN4_9ASCO|nr:hypothetical protein B9G98_01082 [Wickerhamiella sorbophila]PRT53462.1 hypothetical protein B9G98_01082 [Wickerhamiella sorbophila]
MAKVPLKQGASGPSNRNAAKSLHVDRNKNSEQCVYLGNLDTAITARDIELLLAPFGPVSSIFIKKPIPTRNSTYGFVEFARTESAEKCLNSPNRLSFDGAPIVVARKSNCRTKQKYKFRQGSRRRSESSCKTTYASCITPAVNRDVDRVSAGTAETLTPIGSQSIYDRSPVPLGKADELFLPAFIATPADQDNDRTVIRYPGPYACSEAPKGDRCTTLLDSSVSSSSNISLVCGYGGSAASDTPFRSGSFDLAESQAKGSLLKTRVLRVEKIPQAWTATSLFNSLRFYFGDAIRATLVYDDLDQYFFKQGFVEVDNPVTAVALENWKEKSYGSSALECYRSEIESIAKVCQSYNGKFTSYVYPEQEPEHWVHPLNEEMSPLFTPLTADSETPATPAESPGAKAIFVDFPNEGRPLFKPKHTNLNQLALANSAFAQVPKVPDGKYSKYSRTIVLSNVNVSDGGTYLQMLAQKFGNVRHLDVTSGGERIYISFTTSEEACAAMQYLNGATIGKSDCIAELC